MGTFTVWSKGTPKEQLLWHIMYCLGDQLLQYEKMVRGHSTSDASFNL